MEQSKKIMESESDNLTKLAVLAGVTQVVGGIPQALSAINGSVDGLSLITWASWVVAAIAGGYYGYLHNKVPILITNIGWFCVHSAVLISILIYS